MRKILMRKIFKTNTCAKSILRAGVVSLSIALMPVSVLAQAVASAGASLGPALSAKTSAPVLEKIAPTGPVDPDDTTKRIWNLHDADIKAVITTIAQLTGRTFLMDPNLNGHVSIVSKNPMTVDELYQVFLTMLQTLNYTAVHQGLVTRIVPLTDAKQFANEVPSHFDTSSQLNQQVVIDVIPVLHVSALQLVTVLQPLVPNDGLITAYNPSNAIVVSGTAEMVQRITVLIHTLDNQSGSELANIKLDNAKADDLVKLLQELQKNDEAEGKVNTVSYAADTDTNSILVSGSALNLEQAKALIKKLDQGSSNVDNGLTVISLHYVSATSIVPILAKLAGGNVSSTGGSDASAAAASPFGQSMMGSGANNTNNSSGSDNSGASAAPQIGSDISSIFQTDQVVSGGGKDFSLVAVPATNTIVVSAPALMVKKLREIVKLLDVRPKQVLVQALIARVDTKLSSKLGIEWGSLINGTPNPNSGIIGHMSIQGILTALQNDNDSDVLATPSIIVQNNQKATISDGETISVPGNITTASDGATTQGSTQENILLTLIVQPQINSNNSVTLTVAQQDNEIDTSQEDLINGGGAGATETPPIDTSTITTQVLVPDSDVVVLGGLLRKDRSVKKTGVPILSDIPLLGRLFTFSTVDHSKQNLLVFLKPMVLKNEEDDKALSHGLYNSLRTDQLNEASSDPAAMSQLNPVLPRIDKPGVDLPSRPSAVVLPPPFASESTR
jgi:general secretion pathway protein D